jgi:hypothetical protein
VQDDGDGRSEEPRIGGGDVGAAEELAEPHPTGDGRYESERNEAGNDEPVRSARGRILLPRG